MSKTLLLYALILNDVWYIFFFFFFFSSRRRHTRWNCDWSSDVCSSDLALLMMRIAKTEGKPSDESPLRSVIQGFQFAMGDLPMRSALLLLSTLSLFGLQYSVFMPIYANEILKGGRRMLGLLLSFAGVGAFLGALQFAARAHYKGLARWIAATSMTCAVGLIIFSQAKTFWLCAYALYVVGFAATSQMAATNTLIQNRVPDELRSRVMAVYATM